MPSLSHIHVQIKYIHSLLVIDEYLALSNQLMAAGILMKLSGYQMKSFLLYKILQLISVGEVEDPVKQLESLIRMILLEAGLSGHIIVMAVWSVTELFSCCLMSTSAPRFPHSHSPKGRRGSSR